MAEERGNLNGTLVDLIVGESSVSRDYVCLVHIFLDRRQPE